MVEAAEVRAVLGDLEETEGQVVDVEEEGRLQAALRSKQPEG
jgi:hypothetical protein